MKVKICEVDEIKLPQCSRKIHVETVSGVSEEEEMVICKCRRRSRVDNMNEKVKGWTSSYKQQ